MTVYNPKSKIIVIDTEQNAGNFEREMCAYITGQYGECGVGDSIAQKVAADIQHYHWWTSNIRAEPDDNGCRRPVTIYPTPGWFNNGNGKHYRDDPANYADAKAAAIQSMTDYFAKNNAIVRERLEMGDFEPSPGWTKEACERTLASNEASIQRVASSDVRYPAYLSIAIFVKTLPPEEVLDELISRAKAFAADDHGDDALKEAKRWLGLGEKISITGIRLVDPLDPNENKTVTL